MSAADGRDYNAGELSDLMAAKDTDIANTNKAYQQIASAWESTAHADATTWETEWTTLKQGYEEERTKSAHYIALLSDIPLTKLRDFDASTEYTALLRSLNHNWPGAWGAGSLSDLDARLRAAYASLGQQEPQGQPIPQPNPSNDSGLGPTSWQAYVTGLGAKLGLVKNPPPGTPGTQGAPPLIPTWLKWAAGGGLALFIVDKAIDIKKEVL